MTWKPYAKAIAGALTAGLTAAATALTDGSVDPVESITIAIAVITALGVIWAVPNKAPEVEDDYTGRHRDDGS